MLVEFSVQNFLSYGKEVNFSMVAANTVKEMEDDPKYSNVYTISENSRLRILKIGAIYGANASGKSNIIKAMAFFRKMVIKSCSDEDLLKDIDHKCFLFEKEYRDQPIAMEMVFIINGIRYRYGFEIKEKKIFSEWLLMRMIDNPRESTCFTRENNVIKINSKVFKKAGALKEKTRDNALFLTTTAQFNVEMSKTIRDWFSTKLYIVSAPNPSPVYTGKMFMNDGQFKQQILDFVKLIDIGIDDIGVKDSSLDEIQVSNDVRKIAEILAKMEDKQEPWRVMKISSAHTVYDGKNVIGTEILQFDSESFGTEKVFALLGPWFNCLRNGGTLIVDEYGASLHTQLAFELVRLFQSALNSGNAQLIFATHNTNLLRKDLLRRDQIWFVEKDKYGNSDLYSLVEYKINQAQSVRNDASYQKDYLAGKYGAIPYFGDIDKFIKDYSDEYQG